MNPQVVRHAKQCENGFGALIRLPRRVGAGMPTQNHQITASHPRHSSYNRRNRLRGVLSLRPVAITTPYNATCKAIHDKSFRLSIPGIAEMQTLRKRKSFCDHIIRQSSFLPVRLWRPPRNTGQEAKASRQSERRTVPKTAKRRRSQSCLRNSTTLSPEPWWPP